MITLTEDDIREELSNHYGGDNSFRELVKNVRFDDHGTPGSVVYSLEGSPPKGYAIVIPDLRLINLYNNRGERFDVWHNTVVDGVLSGATPDDQRSNTRT